MHNYAVCVGVGISLAVLAFSSPSQAQLSAALVQKAPEASALASAAERDGNVPVIVEFARPAGAPQLGRDAASQTAVRADITAAQNAIISTHFGSVSSPRRGDGFDRALQTYDVMPMFAVRVNRAELDALAADARIVRINENKVGKPYLTQSVPLIGMSGTGGGHAWGMTGGGHTVVVLDSGVLSNHEFLTGKVAYEACFSNGPGGTGRVSLCPNGGVSQSGAGSANPETTQCINGTTNLCPHGTHVAGIAAGWNTNVTAGEPRFGVANRAQIIAVQVFHRRNLDSECGGAGRAPCIRYWTSDVLAALNHIAGAVSPTAFGIISAVNMSFGEATPQSGFCDTHALKTAVDTLLGAGIASVISAGNDGSVNGVSPPGCISTAVTVAASSKTDQIASYSNMGQQVDIIAPGGANTGGTADIRSSVVTQPHSATTYDDYAGTSMAAPHVAGLYAAFRSTCPDLTVSEIQNLITLNGVAITDTRSGGSFTRRRPAITTVLRNGFNFCTLDLGSHDPNGDKKSDIVWRDTSGNTALWLMNGPSVLSSTALGLVPTAWSLAGRRDYDGDGRNDFLWRNTATGDVAMWFMNGGTVASAASVGNVATTWSILGTGDFDRDGNGDILWRDSSGNVAVWLMNGAGVAASGALGNVPAAWSVAAIADYSKLPGAQFDGKTDILWRHTSGAVVLWVVGGTSVLTSISLGTVPPAWIIAGTGDFNGDGFADILWRNTSTGDVAVWLMFQESVRNPVALGAVSSIWTIAETGDFDGDGKSDILWRDSSGNVVIWLMTGTGSAFSGTATTSVKSSNFLTTVPTNWSIVTSN